MMNIRTRYAGRTNERSMGVTLVELMIAAALLVVALGTIYTVAQTTFASASYHDAELAAQEEARRGVQYMVTELREARRSSLATQTLPSDQLVFRIPGDADGNGLPLNVSGYLESVGTVTYTRDWKDWNGDGITTTQLVRLDTDAAGTIVNVTVIANDIMINEDVNGDGALGAGEDLNGSGTLERGIWFDWAGFLIRMTVDSQKTVGSSRLVWASVTADVCPRN